MEEHEQELSEEVSNEQVEEQTTPTKPQVAQQESDLSGFERVMVDLENIFM